MTERALKLVVSNPEPLVDDDEFDGPAYCRQLTRVRAQYLADILRGLDIKSLKNQAAIAAAWDAFVTHCRAIGVRPVERRHKYRTTYILEPFDKD